MNYNERYKHQQSVEITRNSGAQAYGRHQRLGSVPRLQIHHHLFAMHCGCIFYHTLVNHVLTIPAPSHKCSLYLSVPQCGRTARVSLLISVFDTLQPVLFPLRPFSLRKSFQPTSTASPPFPLICLSFLRCYISRHHTAHKKIATATPRPSILKNPPLVMGIEAFCSLCTTPITRDRSAIFSIPPQTTIISSARSIAYHNHTLSPLHLSLPIPFRSSLVLSILLRPALTQSIVLGSHASTVSNPWHSPSSLS